ncbi:hypothetical protein GCM10027062_16750 [Nocardioides hungaricus]
MQVVHARRDRSPVPVAGPRRAASRRLVSLVLALLVALAGLASAPLAAHAAGTDVVTIPDANLKAAINKALGGGRTPDQDVTEADAAAVTTLTATAFTGPIGDLRGVEALTNLTSFQMPLTVQGNTFTDLTPLAGLAKLTGLSLPNGQVSDLTPLGGLTGLKTLAVNNNQVTSLDGLSGLTGLTVIALTNNQVTDLSGMPVAPGVTALQLGGNKIVDIAPLAGKFDKAVLTTLDLSGNRIVDPSPVAAYGAAGGKLGSGLPGTQGLKLGTNRIRDFSAFAGWSAPPTSSRVAGQTVYVGPYTSGGVQVSLKPALASTTVEVRPLDTGFYDQASGLLTRTGTAESLTLFTATGNPPPTWTVNFTTDPDAPVTGPTETTTTLEVTGDRVAGSTLTLSAALSPTAATGEVEFKDEATSLGSAAVTGGTASITTSVLAVGDHTLTAVYAPTDAAAYAASTSTAVTVSIGQQPGDPEPDPNLVAIPDPTLKAAVNARLSVRLGATRTPGQDVTKAEALLVDTLENLGDPLSDLTGLEAMRNLLSFTNISFGARTNTVSDLSPLSGLTKLRTLQVARAQISDVTPLATLPQLETLGLRGNQISDPSPLAGLTKLSFLDLQDNQVADVSRVPAFPAMKIVNLGNNGIRDVAPLVGKFDPEVLTTLDLADNEITDASVLAPIGRDLARIGNQESPTDGLRLRGNRIADLSAFSDWVKPAAVYESDGQSIYVGAYRTGGVTVPLKSARAADTLAVTPAGAGSYDPATGLLTLTDPSAESVEVSPNWTVYFTSPPLDPGDESVQVTGTPQVGQVLSVPPGSAFPGGTCPSGQPVRWLRDGEPVTGNPHYTILPGAWLGGPGTSQQYWPSVTDLGRQLQIRFTCRDTGVTKTSAPMRVTAAEPDLPLAQPLWGPTRYQTFLGSDEIMVSARARPGVVGDPTNPSIPVYLAQADATGRLVDPAGIGLTLAGIRTTGGSSDPEAVTADDIEITGTGAYRTIAIDPQKPTGDLEITFTVRGTTGKETTLSVAYRASRATTPTSRVLMGVSDASTAIDVGDGYLMVADDERPNVRLYDPEVSGHEVGEFPVGPLPQVSGGTEIDFESSARKGENIWWFGSHGNKKAGDVQLSRQSIYQTRLSGTGADATLTPVGVRYGNLRSDLVEWDDDNGGRFGLRAATAAKMRPDPVDGFNMEGVEFSPDGSALYLGLRSPLAGRVAGGKALIVPLTNLEDLTSGAATRARFGEPILLDLGGDSIREIRKNDRGEYLILSAVGGGSTPASAQTLWAWNGDPEIAPRRLSTQLPLDVEPDYSDNAGAWEGIGTMPERLVPGAQVRLIMDQGFDSFYRGRGDNKDESDESKDRTDVVTLSGPVGTQAEVSDPGAFPDQVVNTIGSSREVVVTNTGSNLLRVGKVDTTAEDPAAADDFLVNANACTGETLEPTQTCTIRIRFAPSRANLTSTAELVVASDVPGGSSTVTLTGTALPAPPTGGGGGGGGGPTGPGTPQKATPVVSAGSATVTAGQPASIPVQVAGSAATQPTGTLTLRTGAGQAVGTATLAAGTATLTVPAGALDDGANLLTVEYAGDAAYNGATAPVLVTVTALAKGAAEVSAASVAVDYGGPASIRVQVTGDGQAPPTGTITVTNGDRTVGSAQLAQGTATLTVPADALGVGVNLFTVAYAGDTAYNASAAPVLVTVDRAAARVSVKPIGKVVATRPSRLRVTVTGPPGLSPTGMVTLLAGGRTTTLRLVDGRGTARMAFKRPGTRAIYATYAGNADLSPADAIAKVTVKPAKKKRRQGPARSTQPRATGPATAWQATVPAMLLPRF